MPRCLFAVLSLLLVLPLQAAPLSQPQGNVLLTVTGSIQHTNQPGRAVFDRAMLEALEQRTTLTQTPWVEGINSYTGPLGRALIEAVGAEQAQTLRITALNDFIAEVPVSDFLDYPVILAMKRNDQYLRVRDRGPLFIIYPFDERPNLRTELHYNRSVWQIRAIEFLP